MLEKLIIKNYALIEEVSIDFGEGLSIITGETGAGKSVMMGALGLLIGERADSKILSRQGKATIEAWFDKSAAGLEELFEHHDLDLNDGPIIVRREISQTGRSRAFVNDTPVTLPVLADVTQNLIDIHSQNSNRLLSSPDHQLWLVDSMAGNATLLDEYKKNFRQYVVLRSRIRKMRENLERSRENQEILEYQYNQLKELDLKKGELAEIERKFEILSDADELRSRMTEAYEALDGEEESVLSRVWHVQSMTTMFPEIHDRLHNVYVELSDIAATLESEIPTIESDPLELTRIANRMHELYEAQKRFKVTECDALIELRDSLKSRIEGSGSSPAELEELEKEAYTLAKRLKEQAGALTETRLSAAEKFSERITREAKPLGLKNLRFKVSLSQGKMTATGQDSVEFLCCFNKNQELMPMSKVASGGEMSRLTLTIKGMMADKLKLPTVIFDEIDTGVSGEIADKMGEMMVRIATDMQVVAITHLPQVAAKGSNHYMVYKTDLEDRTVTRVRHLNEEDRVREVARMLSGKKLNDAAIANAKSLLEN